MVTEGSGEPGGESRLLEGTIILSSGSGTPGKRNDTLVQKRTMLTNPTLQYAYDEQQHSQWATRRESRGNSLLLS